MRDKADLAVRVVNNRFSNAASIAKRTVGGNRPFAAYAKLDFFRRRSM